MQHPNASYSHCIAEEFKDAYPSAHLIGVEEHKTKPHLKDVEFTGLYGSREESDKPTDESKFGYIANDEITACFFSGFKNKDIAFLHKDSKTLIVADLMFNLPAKEQYSKSKSSPGGIASFIKPGSWALKSVIGGLAADKK